VSEETHAVDTVVGASFDSVWAWIYDPSKFCTIYPGWIRAVKKVWRADGEAYEGVTRDSGKIKIIPRLDRGGDRLGAPGDTEPESFKIKGYHVTVRRMSERGRCADNSGFLRGV